MVKVTGQLKTKVIHGRNGDFTIATLNTEIGEFSVKDSTLDQYPEGLYDGEFTIQKIYPYSYTWGGNIKIEVRAMLESMVIYDMEEKEMPEEVEPDPIDEPTPTQPEPKTETFPEPEVKVESEPMHKPQQVEAEEQQTTKTDSESKEEMPKQIKLDPTGNRKEFRAQRDRLKELGYKFDPKTQFWTKQ